MSARWKRPKTDGDGGEQAVIASLEPWQGVCGACNREAALASSAQLTPKEAEIELTVLMPCLNEAETLGRCIEKAQTYLRRSGVSGEIVIADNGSTDGSQALAEQLGARVVPVSVRGYGAALIGGSRAARGRLIVMGDSDDSYDFSALGPFVEALRAGADLAMGNRFRGGIFPGAMPFKNRCLGNPVLTGIGRLFFNTPVGDFHCGLRGYSRAAFERMELVSSGMEFASEMVIKATLLGLKVVEVPTTLHKDGRSRPPHLRPWRDGWRHLRFMLLYSPRWLFLYPGLLAMALGGAALVVLMRGAVMVGPLGLSVHTMLYASALTIVGFQLVLFSAFARILATREALLPESPKFNRLFRYLNLEAGLLAGVLLALGGLGGSALAVWRWRSSGFGAMEPVPLMRLAIPSVTMLTLGVELVTSSFFMSMLGLRTISREAPLIARAQEPRR